MPVSDDFLNYVLDQLSGWGGVSARRMFGGVGLYRNRKIFGLIADDVAYLKVDAASREHFIKLGSSPFNPFPDTQPTLMASYYAIPSEIIEDRDELCRWAQRALAVQEENSPKKFKL